MLWKSGKSKKQAETWVPMWNQALPLTTRIIIGNRSIGSNQSAVLFGSAATHLSVAIIVAQFVTVKRKWTQARSFTKCSIQGVASHFLCLFLWPKWCFGVPTIQSFLWFLTDAPIKPGSIHLSAHTISEQQKFCENIKRYWFLWAHVQPSNREV